MRKIRKAEYLKSTNKHVNAYTCVWYVCVYIHVYVLLLFYLIIRVRINQTLGPEHG